MDCGLARSNNVFAFLQKQSIFVQNFSFVNDTLINNKTSETSQTEISVWLLSEVVT